MKGGIEKPIKTWSSSSDVPWITELEEVGFQILNEEVYTNLYDKVVS